MANPQLDEQNQSFNRIHPPQLDPKPTQSAPDSGRRHSLPLHFLPPSLWSSNASSASLVESEEAARGEHILDEASVANRISALRQLNGATRSRHRYAKSTGARSSTFSQPVIVRTYSGVVRPRPQQRDLVVKKENGYATVMSDKMDIKLPPVEAFSFKGIMDEIRHGLSEDLERIAEICARSRYSLSNQYEVHMPPHGRGDPVLVGTGGSVGGPTLQAIGSDEEQTKHVGRGSRGGRRAKSVAYGTLETIMSSSRSSEEDQSKKKPAAVLAEEVRGRAAKKQLESSLSKKKNDETAALETGPGRQRPTRHVRSKSATFASIVIDNAQGSKDAPTSLTSPVSLISEPARPQTSITDLGTVPSSDGYVSPGLPSFRDLLLPRTSMLQTASMSSTLLPEMEQKPTILSALSAWLPWNKSGDAPTSFQQRLRSGSHAEGSLRTLLKSSDPDRKGKQVDRTD